MPDEIKEELLARLQNNTVDNDGEQLPTNVGSTTDEISNEVNRAESLKTRFLHLARKLSWKHIVSAAAILGTGVIIVLGFYRISFQ